jgi:hypothetical protein
MVTTTELNRRGLPYFVAVGADGTTESALVLRDASEDTVTPTGGDADTLAKHLRRIYRRLDALEGSLAKMQAVQDKPSRR